MEEACAVRVMACAACEMKVELRGLTVKGEKVGTLMEGGERGDGETGVFDAEEVKVAEYEA